MGFIAASTSFTRFRIVEDIPQTLWAELTERLKKFGFRDIDHNADERSWGWVNMDDMFDINWEVSPPEKGEYIAFTLRLDTRRVSAAVMKKHLALALRDEERKIKEEGKKYISRDRKKEIKEQVRLKLMARSLPVPSVFDAVWNIRTNIVYLATTNGKIQDMFTELFTDTFELHLEPMTPYFQALGVLGEENQKKLDEVEGAVFV